MLWERKRGGRLQRPYVHPSEGFSPRGKLSPLRAGAEALPQCSPVRPPLASAKVLTLLTVC